MRLPPLAALALLLPERRLAVDAGTGDGSLLDVLAPAFDKVIAVDRSEAQLDRARARVAARSYENVKLLKSELEASELSALTQKVVNETTEPIRHGMTEPFKLAS